MGQFFGHSVYSTVRICELFFVVILMFLSVYVLAENWYHVDPRDWNVSRLCHDPYVRASFSRFLLGRQAECADDELFDKVLINSGHVLYSILPRETVYSYAFRRRRRNTELTSKTTHLAQCSFIVRTTHVV